MKFNDCPLRDELRQGMAQYERDTNVSPLSLIESLIEDFLYKQGYLVVVGDEEVPFPTELIKPRLPHTTFKSSSKKWCIQKRYGKTIVAYAYFEEDRYEEAKKVIQFLKSKNWDLKYSIKQTKLSGKEQFDFLLSEVEKEKEKSRKIKDTQYIYFDKNRRKWRVCKRPVWYGTYSALEDAKKVRDFLISKNWDVAYSSKKVKLKGKKYKEWIFSEMIKEGFTHDN